MFASRSSYTAAPVVIALLGVMVAIPQAATAQGQTCRGEVATIVGTDGDDRLFGTDGPDVIIAGAGNDVIYANGGDDIVCGGSGNDHIRGNDGSDTLVGGRGDDKIFGAAPEVVLNGRADSRGNRILGGPGNDQLHGTNRNDRLKGGMGADQLFGYEGADRMNGGPGRDEVYGGSGADRVNGGRGVDRLTARRGDSVHGGPGVDWCVVTGRFNSLDSCGTNQYEAGVTQRTFGAGTYEVPRQVRVGLYRTTAFHEHRNINGLVSNRTVAEPGAPIVAVIPQRGSTTFTATATRVEAGAPLDPFAHTGGSFLVGIDLEPGTYRVEAIDGGLHWLSTYDLSGNPIDINLAVAPIQMVVPAEASILQFRGRLTRVR